MWSLCCASPQNDDTGLTEFSTTDEVTPFQVLTPNKQQTVSVEASPRCVLTPHAEDAPSIHVTPARNITPRSATPRMPRTSLLQAPALGSTLLGHPMNQPASVASAKAETPISRKTPRSEASCSPSAASASAREKTGEASPFSGAQEHKERLQDMVTDFVRRALRGCPCVFLSDTPSGEIGRVVARYAVDPTLECLTVESQEGGPIDLAQCSLALVQDIVHVAKDGAACFGPRVTEALAPDEVDLLLMIVHSTPDDPGSSIHLLLPSRDEVDMFLECVQVLSIYARSQEADS